MRVPNGIIGILTFYLLNITTTNSLQKFCEKNITSKSNMSAVVAHEILQTYLECLHNNTTAELNSVKAIIKSSVSNNQASLKVLITDQLKKLNATLLAELSDQISKSKVTTEDIVLHYHWIVVALIAMGVLQLVFSIVCFALVLRLNLMKNSKRAQRKGSVNTICSRLEEVAAAPASTSTSETTQRSQDRQSRRLSSRFMRRFDPIRRNSTLIAFLSTPPNYRAPAPPPPPREGSLEYQNVKYHHKRN